ncbi:hypothetical protein QFZ51_005441 [Chitinophaga sp. W3I9]|uniref:hypothetical protein n=1 Tax=Chitinophaga sp. W3I9 TaxID=3373924 RepID=UPI003D2586C7
MSTGNPLEIANIELNNTASTPDKIKVNIETSNSDHIPGQTLWNYIFKNPTNKWFIRTAIIVTVLQFAVFKYLYPYAGFINGDSYSYLETAYHNLSINTYPIGYSMFLRIFSVFTRSDTALIATQYLLVQSSLMAFIFSLFYFYNPEKVTKIILFSFMLFNPVFLYLANYVSSDAFFLSLSMIWFTQLLWIINRPSKRLIVVNALILFLAFTVRYNALFYPAIALVALLIGRNSAGQKIGGIAISFLLIGVFIFYTSNKYYTLTGYRQFTPFTGWQTANNALYAYRYVDSSQRKNVPKRFQVLDRMVRTYFDTTRDIKKYPQEQLVASTVYMWAPDSPLSIYTETRFKKDTTASQLKKWASVSSFFEDYGRLLIRQYPEEYVKFYLIPNALKYYAPPLEFLGQYSTGVDSVSYIAQVWFDYKTNKLKTHFKDYNVNVLNFFPVLTGTMNIVLLFSLISFLILRGHKQYPRLNQGILLIITLWVINFGFSVFASPIALRFQLFPILASFSFTLFLLEFLIKEATKTEGTNTLKNKSLLNPIGDTADNHYNY